MCLQAESVTFPLRQPQARVAAHILSPYLAHDTQLERGTLSNHTESMRAHGQESLSASKACISVCRNLDLPAVELQKTESGAHGLPVTEPTPAPCNRLSGSLSGILILFLVWDYMYMAYMVLYRRGSEDFF